MSRASKRTNIKQDVLADIVGMRMSQSQLSTLLASVRNFDLSESFSRRVVGEYVLERIEPLKHVFELELDNCPQPFQWVFLHPLKLLQELIDNSASLQAAYIEAANRCPPGPDRQWTLIVGFDEFAPGNKLKVNNHRISEKTSSNKHDSLSTAYCDIVTDELWQRMCISHSPNILVLSIRPVALRGRRWLSR